MKLFMQKYLHRISKQGFLNFAGANPKLVTFVIGLGIAVAFTSFGRIFHEALIGSASAFTVTPPEHMPKDEVLHFPVDKLSTLAPTSCQNCLGPEKNPIFHK
jgi:hypothetical protein